MNPIFMSSLAAFFHKVKCPKCNRDQLVTYKSVKNGFRCKFCSNIIQTPKNSPKVK